MEETAKLRVREELKELVEKMCALQKFLFSEESFTLTRSMRYTMRSQLNNMQNYAGDLTHRLEIWDVIDKPSEHVDTDW